MPSPWGDKSKEGQYITYASSLKHIKQEPMRVEVVIVVCLENGQIWWC